MVTVKFQNLLGDECEAEYTEAEYARLQERWREQEKQERRFSDIFEAGLREYERRQEEAAQRPDLDAIDHALLPYLSKEFEKENAETRPRAAHKEVFRAFQKCCERWGLSALPAAPQAVAVYLAEESEGGATHLAKLARSISVIHLACNFSDPTKDILPRAILRLARTDKSSPQKKGQH